MKKRILIGLALGAAAGVLDVIPMVLQGLTWDANLSAFSLWLVSGPLVATCAWKMNPVLKGIVIPFLVLAPVAVLIAWKEPVSLIPIAVFTVILGSLLGFACGKVFREQTVA